MKPFLHNQNCILLKMSILCAYAYYTHQEEEPRFTVIAIISYVFSCKTIYHFLKWFTISGICFGNAKCMRVSPKADQSSLILTMISTCTLNLYAAVT